MADTQVQVRNILVGYGDLYYALYGTPLPAWDDTDASVRLQDDFDNDDNWTYAGATQEGVELGYAPEYGEVNVDQLGDAAITFFDTASVTLNTTLAEATLTNLLVAWGFEDDFLQQVESVDHFSIGVKPQDPVERAVAVVGKGSSTDTADYATNPDADPIWERRDRVYMGRRVVAIEGASLSMNRAENTAFPVSFRLLADPTVQYAEYGIIMDRIPGASVATEPDDAPASVEGNPEYSA